MVRAPCCEKAGLKKGPWTPEEDQILISFIHKYGHANWRALPREAGLLRCGKSCRLRWTNYLRPDIKRGNFTKEEEDMIIQLHQMLGNRWSAIAARLPGRTDNEIKNVWNTHLKKRSMNPDQTFRVTKPRVQRKMIAKPKMEFASSSSSDTYSESSNITGDNSNGGCHEESTESIWSHGVEDIEESFWNEILHMNSPCDPPLMDSSMALEGFSGCSAGAAVEDDGISFWVRTLLEAGDFQGVPEI